MKMDYDHQAMRWHRDEPKHRSDFCGRPEVYEITKILGNRKRILDLGCGEGYFSRKISSIADSIIGVDLSREMIRLAVEKEKQEKKGIEYHVGDVKDMPFIPDSSIDLCIGNYITNYLKPNELPKFYQEIARVTKEKGKFILLMPHPVLELITDYGEAVKYQVDEYDYIESRGKFFTGEVKTIHGDIFEVGLYHSTIEDHQNAISSSELKINEIIPPVFSHELAEKYPVFNRMGGKVACMIITGEKY